MIKYLTCLRPLNLVIVYVTQVIIYCLFFAPYRGTINYDWNLYPPTIFYFGLVTVMIAASGYLINDYFDYESDKQNAKGNKLPRFHNLYYYFVIVTLGFCIAMSIALHIGKPLLTFIYLAATALLYMYSASWKKKVLIGNVVVATFSAFVLLILLYAEKDHLALLGPESSSSTLLTIFTFSIFTFLISMTREIIKDIEDVEGDRLAGYQTLPIVSGVPRTKIFAAFYSIGLLMTLLLWPIYIVPDAPIWLLGFMVLFLVIPICYIIYQLFSKSSLNANFLSKLCKAIMIFGLILLIITAWLPYPIN